MDLGTSFSSVSLHRWKVLPSGENGDSVGNKIKKKSHHG